MDAREWDQHNVAFLDVLGDVCLPQPDRVNCRLSAAAGDLFQLDTIEAVGWHGAAYTIFECEAGSYQIRAGRCIQRSILLISSGSDLVQIVGSHGFQAGDGPIRLGAAVVISAPCSLQFLSVPAANDKIIRSNGSWVTDGFAAATSTVGGTQFNNGIFTVAAISTTTNPNDTLEFAGDVLVNETITTDAGAYVVRGALPGIDQRTDYYARPTATNTFKLHRTRADALAGINAVDITGAASGANRVGCWNGPYLVVGWTASFPSSPPGASTVDGEGEKLLRTGERVAVSAGAATFKAVENNSVLKWWGVG